MKKYIELNNKILKPDGGFDLDKDKEALKVYFQEEVNPKTQFFHSLEEKIRYMTEHGYWDGAVLDQYDPEQVKAVFRLAYEQKFRFESFMGAESFYSRYATKKRDGSVLLERYEDRMSIVALAMSEGDADLALRMVRHLVLQHFTPATPTLMNAGKANTGRLTSCFLLQDCTDNLTSITKTISFVAELSKGGGGIGVSLDNLRAKGESLRGIEGVTKGVIPVAKLLDNTLRYADQAGQRQGAGAVYLNVMHPDFMDLLSAKKIASDDDVRLKTLSIGAVVPDVFMRHVKEGRDIHQFYPHSVKQETGMDFTDIDWERDYQSLVDNPNIRKRRVSARKIFEEIAVVQGESGYPYLLFEGNANRHNPVLNVGTVKMSNLCSEILQPTLPSVYNEYGDEDKDVVGLDVSCNLASVVIKDSTLAELPDVVDCAMRVLDAVSRHTDIGAVPSVQRANREMRSVGLGAMNLNGFLASKGIEYGSEEAIEFVDAFFEAVHFHAREASMDIAASTGFRFTGFEGSAYQDGTYFERYTESERPVLSEKVAALIPDAHRPSRECWDGLVSNIRTFGLAHSHIMAVAPNGSISYVTDSTASIMPITERIEVRTSGKGKTIYPMPGLETGMWYYKEAYHMDMRRVLDTVAAAQKHVDQGISCTLFVPDTTTTAELQALYIYAYRKSIKTLYYTRLKDTQTEDCVACAI